MRSVHVLTPVAVAYSTHVYRRRCYLVIHKCRSRMAQGDSALMLLTPVAVHLVHHAQSQLLVAILDPLVHEHVEVVVIEAVRDRRQIARVDVIVQELNDENDLWCALLTCSKVRGNRSAR